MQHRPFDDAFRDTAEAGSPDRANTTATSMRVDATRDEHRQIRWVQDLPTALLVGDDYSALANIQDSLQQLCAPKRPQLFVGHTLDEAQEILENNDIGLVLSVPSLPGSSDFHALKCLRSLAPAAALVVLTETDDDELHAKALASGAQDYLVKDELSPRALKRTLRHALELVSSQAHLKRIAYYDAITGLANRVAFKDRFLQTVERAKRTRQNVTVMFLDLDRFKSINDTYGHEGGDRVLTEVAARLQAATRPYDTIARLGGDEFGVLLDESLGPLDPERIAIRIARTLAEPITLGDVDLVVTASIGIARTPAHENSADEMLRIADTAMYEAKAAGRNRYHVSSVLSPATVLTHKTQMEVRSAVAAQQFFLHYQPQFALASGRITALEGLLRWRKPDGSIGMPGEFIPYLEDTGLIRQVGEWTLQLACQQLVAANRSDLRVAVNLSARQITEDLPDIVLGSLQRSGMKPELLELEVTESVLMHNAGVAQTTLRTLRESGVRVAIDDFGTGYSSLAYLQRFEVDTLKLDKSFVLALSNPLDRSAVMISAIIGLAHKLDLEVVGEGVETQEQLAYLRDEGCDLGQGYLIARPTTFTECLRVCEQAVGSPQQVA